VHPDLPAGSPASGTAREATDAPAISTAERFSTEEEGSGEGSRMSRCPHGHTLLNEAKLVSEALATSADSKPLRPLDWMPITTTTSGKESLHRDSAIVQPSGIPYEQAQRDMSRLGLSFSDLVSCECCRAWFLSSSRNAKICAKCRQSGRWETHYRRGHRAKLRRLAGIKPGPRKNDTT